MSTPTKYIFGNWKMYLDLVESNTLADELAKTYTAALENIELAVFPSMLALPTVAWRLKGAPIAIGAQNMHWIAKGGYTGEVSAEMLKQGGVQYVLVGHSERRHLFKETNHEVREKVEAALRAGLTPVVCVGETMVEKNSHQAEEVVEAQLRAAYSNLSWPKDMPLIVAYEPVWAISHGTAPEEAGVMCTPEQAESMQAIITKYVEGLVSGVEPVVLYGGSVRPQTIAGYMQKKHISGVLVGAASTKMDSWQGVIEGSQK